MAVAFGKANGSAKKGEIDYFKFKDGTNVFRMFGGILPRYVYWLQTRDGNNLPVECLSFDREEERFANAEKDHVSELFPDQRCSWSYLVLGIDPADNSVKAIGLKKKMFEQILTAAEDLGDPTDPETGWDVYVKRQKTGSSNFNVEYTVQVLKCKPRALTAEEKEAIAASKSIDELFPRPTPEDQLALLKRMILPEEEEEDADDDAVNDVAEEEEVEEAKKAKDDDDIPF